MTVSHPFQQTTSSQLRPAVLPEGLRLYVVGDIHGRLDLLDKTLALIDADVDRRPCRSFLRIFLGDYVDRGPDSAGVLDRLLTLQRQTPTICLAGNHEIYLLRAARQFEFMPSWFEVGGRQTLQSYGIPVPFRPGRKDFMQIAASLSDVLPTHHRIFLETAPLSFTCGDYLFVHAGLRPETPLCEQHASDLTEIRQAFLGYQQSFGKIVVHGHTPVIEPEIRPNRINIDTGAYATGRLTCLVIDTASMSFI